MNAHLVSAPQRRTAGPVQAAIASLLVVGLPILGLAQAPILRAPEQSSVKSSLAPPGTIIPIIPIIFGWDTTRVLGRLPLLGPAWPSPAAERGAKRAKQDEPMRTHSVDYSGPRFGITYLPQAAVDSLKNHSIVVGTTITQFGWQFEREIYVSGDGPRVLNEWVFLAGGLESGVFLPSMTWMVGARDRSGNELGVGPNVSVAGVGLAAAAGISIRSGGVNFPMNIAVAKSKGGARVSFLTGFTIH